MLFNPNKLKENLLLYELFVPLSKYLASIICTKFLSECNLKSFIPPKEKDIDSNKSSKNLVISTPLSP